MKKYLYITIICLLILNCKQPNKTLDSNHVDLSIEQFGSIIQPINGTYYLNKEAFSLVFNFKNPNFILVNSSYKKDLMFRALNEENLVTLPQFTIGNIIAETYFNTEKSIYTSNISSSAWLQESMEKHMFNSLELNNKIYTATRVIENSFDLDENYNTKIEHIDKPLYLVFVVIDKNTDLKNNTELQRISIKIDWLDKPEDAQEATLSTYFHLLADNFPLKKTPFYDDTNFNNTELTELLNREEANLLQLGKIYPNFFTAGYNFKVSPSYRLNIQDNIKTLVLNVAKGEHELETILVNYNIDGELIDHKVIAYDEMAEGMHKISSTIEDNIITKKHYWIDEEEDVSERFKIDEDGRIISNEILDVVLQQLNINKEDIYEDFYSSDDDTYKKALMIIPIIAKQTNDELVLDAYILLVNTKTGVIEAKYTEEKCWRSDEVKISSIEANYQPYKLAENSETIGITVYYLNSTPVNSYTSNKLTLFIKQGDSLKPVLKDFEIYNKTEEYDSQGKGFYIENYKTIATIEDSIKVLYNLKISNSIKEAHNIYSEEQEEKNHKEVEQLIYQNGTYIKQNSN